MTYSNFTNGALVLRVWRFDGDGEVIAKLQYFDDAVLFANSMLVRDGERKANKDGKWFYLAVCENECRVKAVFDAEAIKATGGA